jgi:hypothetical protein
MAFRAAVGTMTVKVYVVYDDSGRIHAISHPIPGRNGAPPALGRFRPHVGQHIATLQVPPEVSGLRPRQLHDAVRIELHTGVPRLVAKTK